MSYNNLLNSYQYQTDPDNYKNISIRNHINAYYQYKCYNCGGNHEKRKCTKPCFMCKKKHPLSQLCYEYAIDRLTEIEHRIKYQYKPKYEEMEYKINQLIDLKYVSSITNSQDKEIWDRIHRIEKYY